MRLVSLFTGRFMLCILCLLLAFSTVSSAAEKLSDYQLGSGDLLSIKVFGEDDLSIEVRLSDAGTLAYPFLGEMDVLNMTIKELSETITVGLADGYLINPNVYVTVLEYREFFINGEVEKPGGYPYQPGLTLQKAVAIAGGFTERASKTKLFIARDKQPDKQLRIKLSTKIHPGDIITIEQSFF
ncbi:polysaccharide biosynthesis/export family protein [Amphritea sp. HPY]|uniref:polysaccharide biosynthesis/export family protein n=1 Tax=Amphritea sp. HPY TaxID=3421652 RepID=UPI003D7DCF39